MVVCWQKQRNAGERRKRKIKFTSKPKIQLLTLLIPTIPAPSRLPIQSIIYRGPKIKYTDQSVRKKEAMSTAALLIMVIYSIRIQTIEKLIGLITERQNQSQTITIGNCMNHTSLEIFTTSPNPSQKDYNNRIRVLTVAAIQE